MPADRGLNRAPEQGFLALSLEALVIVITFLSARDIRRLASTCRRLRHLTTRAADFELLFAGEWDLMRYYLQRPLYMLPQSLLLQSLKLMDGSTRNQNAAILLSTILLNACNLRHLVLHDCQKLVNIHPPLGRAIARLQRLTSLELDYGGPDTINIFTEMRSRPKHIYYLNDPRHKEGEVDFSPLFKSQAIRDVESLHIYGLNAEHLGPRTANLWELASIMEDWEPIPSVRELVLGASELPKKQIARLFPNLQRLTLEDVTDMFGDTGNHEADWPSLHSLCAEFNDLTTWELRSRVHHLEVETTTGPAKGTMKPKEEMSFVVATVRDTSPTVLSLPNHQLTPKEELLFWEELSASAGGLVGLEVVIREINLPMWRVSLVSL